MKPQENLHRIPIQFDVRRLVKPRIDKRGRLLGGFETRSAARRERRHRIRALRASGNPAALIVADVLAGCRPGAECGSTACPECGGLRRIVNSAPILQFLVPYPLVDLRYLTLINPTDARPAGALHTFDPRKCLTRYRRQFERAGINKSKAFIIAYVDGEWDEGWNVYQPHLHAVVHGVGEKALKRLIKKWPRTARVRVRSRIEPIDDLPRVVAYLDKTFWPSVARPNNPHGIHPHGKRRPPKHIEAEILIWLHTQQSRDFVLLFGLNRRGRYLVNTTAVHTKTT